MKKFILIFIILTALHHRAIAQRLELSDVVNIYITMDNDPPNALNNISNQLYKNEPGWGLPSVDRSDGYMASWSYHVGTGIYGIVRFVVQNVNGLPLAKIAYECPYESLYDSYVQDLTSEGAELVDSHTNADGSYGIVYEYKSYIFMLERYPKSLGRTFAGIQTGYFKVLMHHALN